MAVHFSAFFQAPEATVHNTLLPAVKSFSNPKFQSLPYGKVYTSNNSTLNTKLGFWLFCSLDKIPYQEQPTEEAYLSLSPGPSWRPRQQRLEAAPHMAPRVRDREGKCRVLNSLSTWVQAAWQRMTPLRANRCFTSVDAVKIISHRQAQRQLSQGILNSVKLTSDTNIIACMHVLFPLSPPTSVKASLSLFLWM